jgi:hypothetical protein
MELSTRQLNILTVALTMFHDEVCKTGTTSQGGACVPRGNTQVFVNGDGPCPAGWTRSARYYCVR